MGLGLVRSLSDPVCATTVQRAACSVTAPVEDRCRLTSEAALSMRCGLPVSPPEQADPLQPQHSRKCEDRRRPHRVLQVGDILHPG